MSKPSEETIRIGFLSKFPIRSYLRQTRGGCGRDGRFQLLIGATRDVDYIVVHHQVAVSVQVEVPRERWILLVTEPPDFGRYPSGYISQFGTVVSPYRPPGCVGRWVQSHAGLAWFFGGGNPGGPLYNLEGLQQLSPPPNRSSKLSIVNSSKLTRKRHYQRRDVIAKLLERFPDRVELFGRGVREIADKADAILPHRYHLVIENNSIPHFWTEKLADAYLGFALPLYSGCPNITEYFPPGSLIPLPPLEQPEAVLDVIADVLQRDPYEAHVADIIEARRRLIEEHNLIPLLARAIGAPSRLPSGALKAPLRLRPIRDFRGLNPLVRGLERMVSRLRGE